MVWSSLQPQGDPSATNRRVLSASIAVDRVCYSTHHWGGNAGRMHTKTVRQHQRDRFPTALTLSLTSAENRNPHRHQLVARGFLHEGAFVRLTAPETLHQIGRSHKLYLEPKAVVRGSLRTENTHPQPLQMLNCARMAIRRSLGFQWTCRARIGQFSNQTIEISIS